MNQAIFLPKWKSSSSWSSAGGKTGIGTLLETRTENQNFPENLTAAAQFLSIDLFLANDTLYAAMTFTLHKATEQLQPPEIFKSFFRC